MSQIAKLQSKEENRFLGLLGSQEGALSGQLELQQDLLDSQLDNIAGKSEEQERYYTSLLGLITRQQETELSAIRDKFSQQNLQSEETISRLQKDIERLSLISSQPSIPVDTRPGIIGLSSAQQSSQSRQRLGMIGSRKTAPQRTSALGLNIAA
jgi:hypothetical protein